MLWWSVLGVPGRWSPCPRSTWLLHREALYSEELQPRASPGLAARWPSVGGTRRGPPGWSSLRRKCPGPGGVRFPGWASVGKDRAVGGWEGSARRQPRGAWLVGELTRGQLLQEEVSGDGQPAPRPPQRSVQGRPAAGVTPILHSALGSTPVPPTEGCHRSGAEAVTSSAGAGLLRVLSDQHPGSNVLARQGSSPYR